MKRLLIFWLLLWVICSPCFAQEPTTPPKPAAAEAPASTKEPAKTEEPAAKEPASPQAPADTEKTGVETKPAKVDQPSAVEAPAASDPAVVEDPAAVRFGEFVASVSKSRRLVEIKPFFSQRMWKAAFVQPSVTENAERQRTMVKEMARTYSDYTITETKAVGPRVELTVVTKDPQGQPASFIIQMVQEHDVWVIDG